MLSRLFRFLRSKTYKHSSSSLPPTSKTRTKVATTTSVPAVPAPTTCLPPSKYVSTTDTHASYPKRIFILDLDDVLFHYSLSSITALPAPAFSLLIKSPGWAALECGLITEAIAVQSISKDLSLDIDTINEALAQCRQLLHVDHDLFNKLVELKREINGMEEKGGLEVYAMTNISRDDFGRLKVLAPRWHELFDRDFTSFEVGRIKPDAEYYQHVIDSVGLQEPSMAVFVDDKKVNVDAARSFGIYGIVFESPAELMRELRAEFLISNPSDGGV